MIISKQTQNYLIDTAPELYRFADPDRVPDGEPHPPITYDGLACPPGWVSLLLTFSQTVEDSVNNNEQTDDTVHAVQVKQKFGGLRIYLDNEPEYVGSLRQLIESLSRRTCEQCGSMQEVRRRQSRGIWRLCEACDMNHRGVPSEVDIVQFPYECFECGDSMSVVYPVGVGGKHGGTWSAVGPELVEADYSTVQRVWSPVQCLWVYGNVCDSCNAYQGNYYVYDEFTDRVGDFASWDAVESIEKVDSVPRRYCNREYPGQHLE